ncbi:MAG TPA: MBL fold metallo-hydrolase [bacterium]|nr:MBL fold metallo-hydrolase [bacterium]
MAHATKTVRLERLMEGSHLFCSPQGNVLFGCPPEILKRILAANLPMPDSVVLPETLHHQHSSQASLEFPLYHFLFVQRGLERRRLFQVVAYPQQCDALAEMLRVTVFGPSEKEMVQCGTEPSLARELWQEADAMALKKPGGKRSYTIREMINFLPARDGARVPLYPARQKLPELSVERVGAAQFRVLYGEEAFHVDLAVSAEQLPNYALKDREFKPARGEFKLHVLGRSNGFDPRDPANGYLIAIDGKVVLWDCPAYLHLHLQRMQFDPRRIDAFVLSHVHEDHLDVSESLRDPPHDLYATPEVYLSLLKKLVAVYACSEDQARAMHHWHPIQPGQPMSICGAEFQFFHSVHAIPAVGCRISKTAGGRHGLLHLSGDHLAQEVLQRLHSEGGVSERRFAFFQELLTGKETLLVMDAGGGTIHGDYRDYLNLPNRVAYMHTGLIQEDLPPGKSLLTSGEEVDILGED